MRRSGRVSDLFASSATDSGSGAAFQGIDHHWADINPVEMLYPLKAARALRVDLNGLVANHVHADKNIPS